MLVTADENGCLQAIVKDCLNLANSQILNGFSVSDLEMSHMDSVQL